MKNNCAKKTITRTFKLYAIALMLALVSPLPAVADSGPKPSIVVNCVNLPDGDVYIDLLIDAEPRSDDFRYGKMNSDGSERDAYDGKIIALLESYNVDGWRPALVTGTSMPIWGELKRTAAGGKASANFDYHGVPKRFRVIVATTDGSVTVTNVIERKAFNSTVGFDYAKKSAATSGSDFSYGPGGNQMKVIFYEGYITERNPVFQTGLQAVFTLGLTYLIEGLILLLFGFSLRKNWKPFVLVNLGTQIALNLSVAAMFYFSGTDMALIVYFACEIMILVVETVLYVFLLKQHSRLRRALYAVVANVTSFIAGFLLFALT